jgi:AcrR family transcriptional regulator
MRSTEKRTFLDEARRTQIVACAIEVIAERGYANTSLANIAERAGTSKGVILYHFAGKDELIEQVVAEVFAVATAELVPKLQTQTTARGQLRTYIEARVGFLTTHLRHMRALMEIWLGYRGPDGKMQLADAGEPTLDAIEQLLVRGQENGEFRSFPTRPMAVTIGQAIDGALLQRFAHPELDLAAFAAELVTIFDLATRSS